MKYYCEECGFSWCMEPVLTFPYCPKCGLLADRFEILGTLILGGCKNMWI